MHRELSMDLFVAAPLSISSKPILLEKEIEIKLHSDIEILLETSNKEVLLKDGHLILTNHRLIYIAYTTNSKSLGWAIMLQSVIKVEDCTSGMLSRSTRIRLLITNSSKILNIKFLKHNTGKEELLQLIQRQLSKKSWEQHNNIQTTEETVAFSISNAGVGGLLRKQERDLTKVDAITREALSDLDTLMKSAKDVVNIVERYSATLNSKELNKNNTTNPSSLTDSNSISDSNSSISGEINEMENILQSIGIISPVTKFSAGRLYHKELSKQIGDFLLQNNLLKRMGSMATLPDIYCLYNRSRGTELVSPDDFLKATQNLESLNIGLKIKKFKSGVLSIHLDEMDDTVVTEKILQFLDQTGFSENGINASTLSELLKVSLIVAKEQLLLCESNGKLCRDETIEGVFFFPNLFVTKFATTIS